MIIFLLHSHCEHCDTYYHYSKTFFLKNFGIFFKFSSFVFFLYLFKVMTLLPSISGIVSVLFLVGVYLKWPVYTEGKNNTLFKKFHAMRNGSIL